MKFSCVYHSEDFGFGLFWKTTSAVAKHRRWWITLWIGPFALSVDLVGIEEVRAQS